MPYAIKGDYTIKGLSGVEETLRRIEALLTRLVEQAEKRARAEAKAREQPYPAAEDGMGL